jgi:hypothetical protein
VRKEVPPAVPGNERVGVRGAPGAIWKEVSGSVEADSLAAAAAAAAEVAGVVEVEFESDVELDEGTHAQEVLNLEHDYFGRAHQTAVGAGADAEIASSTGAVAVAAAVDGALGDSQFLLVKLRTGGGDYLLGDCAVGLAGSESETDYG